ncbi:ABC transporter permease [Microbacteriaceae bacterium VKM Ac-2855]|nr:ABC transporter permease [Microbacteriaceae bacterium VKM Ac-2855]
MITPLTFARREPAVLIAYAALAITVIAWASLVPQLTLLSVTNSIGQKLPIVCVTIGVAIVLISRGVDLSVGAILTLANVIVAKGSEATGQIGLWILVAFIAAGLAGALNGILISVVRLSPLIVTLGTSSVLFGVSLYIAPVPGGSAPDWFSGIPLLLVGPIPLVVLLLILIPVVLWWPLKRSRYGTALYAVGNDEGAAFTAGVDVRSTLTWAYVLSALFSALGGVILTMNAGSGDANIGASYTLTAVAGAAVGGVALSGGRGTVVGAVAGALILSFLNNLLFTMGINTYWQYVATGVLLLLALSIPLGLGAVRKILERKRA